jgi:hypothetical protein
LSFAESAFLVKIACGSFALGATTWAASFLLTDVFQQHGFLVRALITVFLGALGISVYIGICYSLGVREVNSVLKLSYGWLPSTWRAERFGET